MTILVQMANFIIAYVMIRKLFLTPAMQTLTNEEIQATETLSTIEKLKKEQDAKKNTMVQRWATCHSILQAKAPKVVLAEKSMLIKEFDTSVRITKPSADVVQPMVTHVAHKLAERLRHVR